MTLPIKSRRAFLASSGCFVGVSWLGINMPLLLSAGEIAGANRESEAAYKNLSPRDALEYAALANQIIPPDETPGAADIGVVYYIDYVLGDFMAGAVPMLKSGLEDLQLKTKSAHAAVSYFSELSFEQQTGVLRLVEDTRFFGALYFMTMCGMFCLPAYGGNRNNAGWDLLGFDHQHVWQPPFGYYDAAVHGPAPVREDEQ